MKYLTSWLMLLLPVSGFATTVKYELLIENKPVNLSGKKTVDFALTVNGGIPAPTLEFTEGDVAEINVVNKLENEEVSIHWHGLLLPPEEDGVAYVNTPPIYAGKADDLNSRSARAVHFGIILTPHFKSKKACTGPLSCIQKRSLSLMTKKRCS